MFEAFGWIIVSSNLEIYTNDFALENLERLDDQLEQENKQLWENLRQWILDNANIHLKWNFYESLNNINGVLRFTVFLFTQSQVFFNLGAFKLDCSKWH